MEAPTTLGFGWQTTCPDRREQFEILRRGCQENNCVGALANWGNDRCLEVMGLCSNPFPVLNLGVVSCRCAGYDVFTGSHLATREVLRRSSTPVLSREDKGAGGLGPPMSSQRSSRHAPATRSDRAMPLVATGSSSPSGSLAAVSGTVYVLVPPSESKAFGGFAPTGGGKFLELNQPRRAVTTALRTLATSGDDEALTRILRVRGPLLERAHHALDAHVRGTGLVLPAWQRYEGVVWSHLDPGTLTPGQRARLLIPSALYGVHAGDDEIEDYRLTFKIALAPLGGLATFWRPFLTSALRAMPGTFVNLLPREHEAAIEIEALRDEGRLHTVRFTQANGYGAAGHDAKAVKGVVARVLLRQGLAALEGFTWEGWTSMCDEGEWRIVAPATPVRKKIT